MAYLNKIDINGRTYYLQHLTDGKNEAKLPTPVKDDELLLRSQVVNSVTSKDSQSGYRVPLSAAQGYSLNSKLNKEIVDREADVDEEQARAEAAEQVLTDNLNKEIQDRISDVDAEETRALAAEKVLTDNLAKEVQDRTNDVNEEQLRAENAEKVLTDNLNKEIQDRTDDVNAEETRALAAEKVLTDNLAQEVQNRINDVNTEEARALAAEKVLTDNLTQEVVDRTNAVTTEQNRATAKENEISANLTAEINRAKVAEQTNATAIATEKSRAESVESNHESRIVTMETFFKEADIDASKEFIDTLKEIQTYISDDKTGAAAMSASIQANKTAIETENGRAEGVEADLQSQITTEAATARAAEKVNADAIAVLNGSADGSVAKAVDDAKTALESEINKKVDKIDGKGLSANDYSDAEKEKLEGIETGANKYIHPSYNVCASGLYKITVDEFGHVSNVVPVSKKDIVDLGIPAQDTIYEVTVATTETEDGVDGLLSAADKAKYDKYEATISGLVKQIEELQKLVESYHPIVEPEEPEPEPEETE